MILMLDGAVRADLNTPVGFLADLIAAQFSPPPSPVRVGADRRELTFAIVVRTQLVVVVLFSALLWIQTRRRGRTVVGNVVLALQAVLGLATMSSLLYVLAAQFAFVLPTRRGLAWLCSQMLALVVIFISITLFSHLSFRDDTLHLIWIYCAIGLLFQVLAFGLAWLAKRDYQSRIQLASVNANLLATQSMLSDTVRASERLRIARDLHDAVGHHLTALNLHLDLALRQTGSGAPKSLHTSRELAGNLLSEVRGVVSSERREHIDLRNALATLCRGIPEPKVLLVMDDGINIASPELAHAIFFCVQEALTNTVRHANAAQFEIKLSISNGLLYLKMEDDGDGMQGAAEGNGLQGMRERITKFGGTLGWLAGPPRGCRLALTLPLDWSPA